jgi:hypothetical protein
MHRWVTFARLEWDRTLAILSVAAAIVVVTIGWFGISGTEFPAKQVPYLLSAGVGGILLFGAGAVLWLSADLRDEWRKFDMIEDALRQLAQSPDHPLVDAVEWSEEHLDYEPAGRAARAASKPVTESLERFR